MICLLALVVFAILGIFSVRYRKLALKAVDCVFRRVTLRPCQSGMDRKLKNQLLGIVSRKNVKLAKIIAKHFEIVAWVFTIIMLLSIVFSVRGLYFYAVYGNCNGANSESFCVFDALNPSDHTSACQDPSILSGQTDLIRPSIDTDPAIGPDDAKVTIIEFGCYGCPYTKEAEPVVKKILTKYKSKVKYVYRDFPLPNHQDSKLRSLAANCALDQDDFWKYHYYLFENLDILNDEASLINAASELGLDSNKFSLCLSKKQYEAEVEKDFEDGKTAGVYGTPTFFINDEIVVGPRPYRYFKNIIDKELKQ